MRGIERFLVGLLLVGGLGGIAAFAQQAGPGREPAPAPVPLVRPARHARAATTVQIASPLAPALVRPAVVAIARPKPVLRRPLTAPGPVPVRAIVVPQIAAPAPAPRPAPVAPAPAEPKPVAPTPITQPAPAPTAPPLAPAPTPPPPVAAPPVAAPDPAPSASSLSAQVPLTPPAPQAPAPPPVAPVLHPTVTLELRDDADNNGPNDGHGSTPLHHEDGENEANGHTEGGHTEGGHDK